MGHCTWTVKGIASIFLMHKQLFDYEATSQVFKYIKSDPAIVNAMNKPCVIARYSCIFSKIVLISNA